MNVAEKLPLSLVLIAHNEAANLPRCLDSAAPLAREIVVVTNDCTDDTAAIAQRYGARVYEHPWQGHRDQKNLALSYVTQPWILCLDADEELTPQLATNLREFIQRDDPKFSGAYFARCVFFLGRWIRHGDWYPDWSLRLIRRGKGQWGGTSEHDQMQLDGPSAKLAGDLNHYSYRDLDHHLLKLPYYANYFLKNLQAKNARWSAFGTIFRCQWRFFRCYFLRLGFLDGYPGFYIAYFQSFSALFRHTKLYEDEIKKSAGKK
ncbi:MAG TPA: glycosyltransferase family 2 protein [Opitutales bacterium]|jgi:glycosyltransferase involved in cell wall biosynthesis|nr:glycosyltransferase family 2 protein [Opitutales bacterium]